MIKYDTGLVALLLVLSGCPHMIGKGTGMDLNVPASFVYEDGSPAPDEPIYIVETIGTSFITTMVTRTDENGRVVLSGYFCTPTYVAANGANDVISTARLRESYVLIIRNDRVPTLEHGFGPPIPDSVHKRPRRYRSCG